MTWTLALAGLAIAVATVAVAERVSAGPGGWRVTFATMRRRGLRFLSYKFRLVFMAANVALFIGVAAFVAAGLIAPALAPTLTGRGKDVILYVITGLVAWPIAWTGYQASAAAVREEQELGTLETTASTPAGLEALPFASYVANTLESLVWAVLFLLIAVFVFPDAGGVHVDALPVAVAAITLAGLFLWGVGLFMAALTTYYKELGSATTFLQYGLIVLSGAYIPLDVLPGPLAVVGKAFPLTIAFDLLRGALFGGADGTDALVRLAFLAVSALGMVAVGTWAFAKGIAASRRAGVLAGY